MKLLPWNSKPNSCSVFVYSIHRALTFMSRRICFRPWWLKKWGVEMCVCVCVLQTHRRGYNNMIFLLVSLKIKFRVRNKEGLVCYGAACLCTQDLGGWNRRIVNLNPAWATQWVQSQTVLGSKQAGTNSFQRCRGCLNRSDNHIVISLAYL